MVEILRFATESFGHYVGVCFLMCLAGFWLMAIAMQLGKIARPRKKKIVDMRSTHKL